MDRRSLILVQTVPAIRALMHATKSIPIVMVGVGNPVELGIVASLVQSQGGQGRRRGVPADGASLI